jgi:hypothetical protein
MHAHADTEPTQVRQLLDRTDITNLVHRLGVCLDEGRFDVMADLFVEEATASTPGGTAQGRLALVAQAARNHQPEDRIQHVITNVLVDLDGDRATVRANLVVHFSAPAGEPALAPPLRFTLGEVYRFEAVRTPPGWRLSRVETTPVWMSGTRPQPATDATIAP